MTKQEQLQKVLDDVCESVPEVRGAVLASREGLGIVSSFANGEGSRLAAMAATVHALAARVVDTTDLGSFEETVIQSEAGTFVVYDAGDLAVLAVLARGSVNLGLLHIEGRRAASAFVTLLAAYRQESYEPSYEAVASA